MLFLKYAEIFQKKRIIVVGIDTTKTATPVVILTVLDSEAKVATAHTIGVGVGMSATGIETGAGAVNAPRVIV